MAECIKKCEYCGKEFNPNSGSQKYCSEECYKEHRKEYIIKWNKNNPEKVEEYIKRHRKYKRYNYKCIFCNEEFITNQINRNYCYKEKCIKKHKAECSKIYKRKNYEQIKLRQKQYNLKWYHKNKETKNKKESEKQKKRYKEDLQFKLTTWSRYQVRRCLNSNKTKHTFDILGYTPEMLKQRLEMNFKSDMNWDNHGTLWHIDHRKPLCKFNLTLPDGTPNYEQIRLANSLANLQPLYVTENLSKNGKFELPTTKSLKCING